LISSHIRAGRCQRVLAINEKLLDRPGMSIELALDAAGENITVLDLAAVGRDAGHP
jgi:hypothetical protein